MKLTRGSTIIEVLIAATLISTAVLAALSLGSSSQKQTDFSRYLNQATIYNNQAVDWVRNLRSKVGWESFVNELDLDTDTNTVTYCLNTIPTTPQEFAALPASTCQSAELIGGTIFQREISLTFTGSPITSVAVQVTTFWQTRTHQISTDTVITKW